MITKAFKEKWAHISGLLQTLPGVLGRKPGVWGRVSSTPRPNLKSAEVTALGSQGGAPEGAARDAAVQPLWLVGTFSLSWWM